MMTIYVVCLYDLHLITIPSFNALTNTRTRLQKNSSSVSRSLFYTHCWTIFLSLLLLLLPMLMMMNTILMAASEKESFLHTKSYIWEYLILEIHRLLSFFDKIFSRCWLLLARRSPREIFYEINYPPFKLELRSEEE